MRLKSIQKRSDFDSILFTGSAAQTANIQRWSRHPVRNTHVTTTGMCVTHTSTPLQPQRLSEMVSPLQPQACVSEIQAHCYNHSACVRNSVTATTTGMCVRNTGTLLQPQRLCQK